MRECGRHSEMEPAEYHGDPLRRLTDFDYRAAEQASQAIGELAAARARCRAVLFPLEPSRHLAALVVREAWANGVPVHPLLVPYGDPVQGPRPAACAREPHPDSPWHWNGRTWWK